MPCVPIAGKQEGMYMVPQVGAGVWIEFEQGDPDYPIWVGGFWGIAAEVPPAGARAAGDSARTDHRASNDAANIRLSSAMPAVRAAPVRRQRRRTGGIMLSSPTGAMIVVNDTGIYINNGKGASIDHDGADRDDQQRRLVSLTS